MSRTSVLTAAIETARLLKRGVFPTNKSKAPLTEHGFRDAVSDPAHIKTLFAEHPDATGYGIATGLGLAVVDLDVKNDGLAHAGKLQNKHGDFPETVAVKTGGGGVHLYFATNGAKVKSVNGKLAPGVDVKADGGYVIGPGSLHLSGQKYRWINPPDRYPLAPLPTWIVDRLKKDSPGDPAHTGDKVPEGKRNAYIARQAGVMRNKDIAKKAILEAMLAENAERCAPPLPEDEITSIVASICNYKPGDPTLKKMVEGYGEAEVLGAENLEADWTGIEILSAAEIGALELPDIRWTVPNFLPQGLAALCAKPKSGKSYMALGIGIAVACPLGRVLGKYGVSHGDVLYLALESTTRQNQKRLDQLLQGDPHPERLHITTRWKRLDKGGLELLHDWVKKHPEARLVIVDTLQRIRAPGRFASSVYEQDYDAITPLKELADKFSITVLLIHHTRKTASDDVFETINGSYGLSGAMDTLLVLGRDRGRADSVLSINGRDIEEQELALSFRDGIWTVLGTAEDYRLTQDQQEILEAMRREDRPLAPKDIAAVLGRKAENVKKTLYRMLDIGSIRKADYGKYLPTSHPTHPSSTGTPSSPTDPPLRGTEGWEGSGMSGGQP